MAALLKETITNSHLRHVLVGRGVLRAKQLAAPVSLPRLVEIVVGSEPGIVDVVRSAAGSGLTAGSDGR